MRTQFPAIFQFPLVQQTRSYFGYNRQKMTCIWTCTSKAKVYSEYKNKSYLKLDVLLVLAPTQIIFKTFSLEKLNDLRNVQVTEFSSNLQSLVGSQSYLKPFCLVTKNFALQKFVSVYGALIFLIMNFALVSILCLLSTLIFTDEFISFINVINCDSSTVMVELKGSYTLNIT